MELQLRLALPDHCVKFTEDDKTKRRRSRQEAFGKKIRDGTVDDDDGDGDGDFRMRPSLLWSGRQPNEEDDREQKDNKRRSSNTNNKHDLEEDDDEEEEQKVLVGWPPIRSWRKQLLHDQQPGQFDWRRRQRII